MFIPQLKLCVLSFRRSYVNKAVHRGGSTQGIRTTGAVPQISFIQDFSKVSGQSGIVANKPQSFNRISSQVRPIAAPK